MDPRHLESAAEFCKIVGKPNLLEYLGLSPSVSPKEAKDKLKARRKYMQGMQSNPKYREEALFLIKHFSTLSKALASPEAYVSAVARQQESSHLPIVEMTIKSVLKGGALSPDQVKYLRRNALELGVTEATFEQMFDRLAAEAGVSLPGDGVPTQDEPAPGTFEAEGDLYHLLAVPPSASRDEIYRAYKVAFATAREHPDRTARELTMDQLDRAWKLLSDASTRRAYDLSRRTTGPPARDRTKTPSGGQSIPTAPPVRERSESPPRGSHGTARLGGPPVPVDALSRGTLAPEKAATARLEIAGDRHRELRVGAQPLEHTVLVRNTGGGRMPGRVSTDEPWLLVRPAQLDPDRSEQVLTVRVDPNELPSGGGTAVLAVQTDAGERAAITFEARRVRSLGLPIALLVTGVGVGLLLLVAAGVAVSLMSATPPSASLTITINPTAEEVLLDGRSIGSGSSVYVPEVAPGRATLTVHQPNFKPFTTGIVIPEGRSHVVPVVLDLERSLDFRPSAGLEAGSLDPALVERVMGPRSVAMDQCVQGLSSGEGSVRIHVAPTGHPAGIEIGGPAAKDTKVRACLERQAAAALFTPFDGDYTTVRYDYQVTEASP